MSIRSIFSPSMGYFALKFVVLGWAALAVFSHGYFWTLKLVGRDQAAVFRVAYPEEIGRAPSTVFDFVLTSLVVGLLVSAFWYGFQAIRSLERAERAYSDLVRHLGRFATALFLYSLGAVLADILLASVAQYERTQELGLVLIVAFNQISLLIISIILFLICNALRLADEAVAENQSFL